MTNHTVNAITVKQLRKLLAEYPDNLPVVFGYDSGDYWHTRILGQIDDAEQGYAEWSDYHNKLKEADYDEEVENEDGEVDEKYTEVLILK
jgi:hypothetical protein